jgi:hypothetical protein
VKCCHMITWNFARLAFELRDVQGKLSWHGGTNANHEKSGHSKVSTSLKNGEFLEKVVSVVVDLHENRGIDFNLHQVSRKSLTIGQGFARDHGGPV